MSTATLPPPPAPAATPAPRPAAAPVADRHPNLFLRLLRRWPWPLLGLAVGLAAGLLYYLRWPPTYESAAQLLVARQPSEATPSARDDVGAQVILLGSDSVLRLAAERHLDKEKPFEAPPPDGAAERVGFLRNRLTASREREPGADAPSDVILLSFRADRPADAPKYLRAVVAAYRDRVKELYGDAPARPAAKPDDPPDRLKEAEDAARAALRESERKLREIGQDPARLRQQVTEARAERTGLERRRAAVEAELKQIREAGPSRAERAALLQRLQPAAPGAPRDSDAQLGQIEQLRAKKGELARRRGLGPGHPEMVAIDKEIRALEERLGQGSSDKEDGLERYRKEREAERAGIDSKLAVLTKQIDADEAVARQVAALQQEVRDGEDKLKGLVADREAATRERGRAAGPRQAGGGLEVRELSPPADGVRVAPVLGRSLLLGGGLGLLLGLLVAAGLALRDEPPVRVEPDDRSPPDLGRLGLTVLGHVPVMRTTDPPEAKPAAALDPSLAVVLRPRSADAEAVRGVRTQLLFSTRNQGPQVIQVTGPAPGDGGTTLAANLAAALARADKRVVLVDCDFRRPRVHKVFGLADPPVGIATVLTDQADLADAVHSCDVENLSLLPCGPRPANPAELLTAPRFGEVLADLRANYDFVVVDTPPVLAVSDPLAAAPRADGVILVFRMTPDAGPAAERARDELAAVGAKLLGVVANASAERDGGYGRPYAYDDATG